MPLTQIEESITHVVDEVGPSVVTIATVQVARDQYLRPFPIEGIGSGVVVHADGLIVTNHHVIRGARRAQVRLSDGRRLEAEYVGGDPESDLAIVRIPVRGLPPVKLAADGQLRVGQLAIAIGSPFGQMLDGPTVTVGVVSALHRTLQSPSGVVEDLLQTDAPINPGNSGGPLLNSAGELIGINTAIIPLAQGIGFAIPVERVRSTVEQILEHGRVVRPWLGIAGVTVTHEVAERENLAIEHGAWVFHVDDGSPAADAGVRPGDVIVAANGEPVRRIEDLRAEIARRKPGDEILLDVLRRIGTRRIRIQLRERPA